MKRILALLAAFVLLAGCASALASSAPAETAMTTQITARFATVEEGQQLMRERTLFHNQITDDTLAFYLQKKGGTLDEYIEYSAEQVMAFTPQEELRVNTALDWLQ